MVTWPEVQQGIFDGESKGDYNALFNYQNKPEGIFNNIRLTDMTVDEALLFADPKGDYARYVASLNNGQIATPMGAYQIVGTTLRDAKKNLNLKGDEKLTPSLQDKIGKWIYETQGTKAWAGYKGPKGGKNMNQPLNALQMQQQRRGGGLMGFLRDPRTRQALSSMSRTSFGARMNELAKQDLDRGLTQEQDNRTAQFLMSQPNGKKFAEAVLSKTLTGQQAYNAWLKESDKIGKEGTLTEKQFGMIDKLNDDLRTAYKQYDEIFNGYSLIRNAMATLGDGTAKEVNESDLAAGQAKGVLDLQLTIAFAKILDPESVVRSEEGEAIANSGSGMQAAIARFSNFINGRTGTLPQAVRDTIYQTAQQTAQRYYTRAKEDYERIKLFASKTGIAESDINDVLQPPQSLDNITPLPNPTQNNNGNGGEDPRPQSAKDANISIEDWNDMNESERAPFL